MGWRERGPFEVHVLGLQESKFVHFLSFLFKNQNLPTFCPFHIHARVQPHCSTVTCRTTYFQRTSFVRTATPGPRLNLGRPQSTETPSSRVRSDPSGQTPWSTAAAGAVRCSSYTTVDSIRGPRSVSTTMGGCSRIKVGEMGNVRVNSRY